MSAGPWFVLNREAADEVLRADEEAMVQVSVTARRLGVSRDWVCRRRRELGLAGQVGRRKGLSNDDVQGVTEAADGCPKCHLRGEDHVCLRGDATRGLGTWT